MVDKSAQYDAVHSTLFSYILHLRLVIKLARLTLADKPPCKKEVAFNRNKQRLKTKMAATLKLINKSITRPYKLNRLLTSIAFKLHSKRLLIICVIKSIGPFRIIVVY